MALTVYGSPYVDGTDLVANWPAASLTVAQSIDAAGYYIGRGNNTQTGSYTTVLTDAGKTITMSNASANTVTIPANSSVAYVIGSRINILNLGAGACTPTAAAGVTINGTITALATNQAASVIKTATNTWSYVPFSSGVGAAVYSDANTGTYTGFAYKTFTGSGTLTVTTAGLADLVICGAGGAGFTGNGYGGGAAGGVLQITGAYLPAGVLTVTIGAGGALSNNGVASSIGSYYAPGGGSGSAAANFGFNGGSGGGGSYGGKTGGAGISGLGNAGGTGATGDSGGGGGGAAAVGGNGVTSTGGAGGAGTTVTLAGTTPSGAYVAGSYALGGGGGGAGDGTSGAGGSGGGGAGGGTNNGTANKGGGGGGSDATPAAGTGGSGIVIVRVAV